MEPIFEKLARQKAVKKLFETIRGWDRRSDKWMLSKPLKWRILMLVIAAALVIPAAAAGTEALLAIGLVLCFVDYLFLLPNFGLIVTAKQGLTFKLVNLGIFAAYLAPLAVAFFYSDNFFDHFFLAFILIPVAILLHFIYLIFACQRIRQAAAWKAVKFVISMLVMCVVCTIVWDAVVVENLYDNTDDNMMGFLHPFYFDGWIGQSNVPVVAVDHVVHGRSMSDPDEIKKGWTIIDLWLLWFAFVGGSVMISAGAAWLPWMPRHRTISNNPNQ